MSYYKVIDGKKMDAKLIDEAILLVKGAGDGRLSLHDASLLLKLVTDGNLITFVENDTIEYLFRNFRWTPAAEEWFKKEMNLWHTHKAPVKIPLTELAEKHFSTSDVFQNPSSQAARIHSLEVATAESSQDHDEIGLWIRLKDGTTVEVFSNFIELDADFVQLKGGLMVPVKAIEKVVI